MQDNEKQTKIALAREKWKQKRKLMSQGGLPETSPETTKDPVEKPPKEISTEPEITSALKEPNNLDIQLNSLLEEVNNLRKTRQRKLKKIEYYGDDSDDDEKVVSQMEPSADPKPINKKGFQPQPDRPPKDQQKIPIENFFNMFS